MTFRKVTKMSSKSLCAQRQGFWKVIQSWEMEVTLSSGLKGQVTEGVTWKGTVPSLPPVFSLCFLDAMTRADFLRYAPLPCRSQPIMDSEYEQNQPLPNL